MNSEIMHLKKNFYIHSKIKTKLLLLQKIDFSNNLDILIT